MTESLPALPALVQSPALVRLTVDLELPQIPEALPAVRADEEGRGVLLAIFSETFSAFVVEEADGFLFTAGDGGRMQSSGSPTIQFSLNKGVWFLMIAQLRTIFWHWFDLQAS